MRIGQNGDLLYANDAALPFLDTWKGKKKQTIPDFIMEIVVDALNTNRIKYNDIHYRDQVFSFAFTPIANEGYVNLYGNNKAEQKKDRARLTGKLKAVLSFF